MDAVVLKWGRIEDLRPQETLYNHHMNDTQHPLYAAIDLAHDCGARVGRPAMTQAMLEGILYGLLTHSEEVQRAVAHECELFVRIHHRMLEVAREAQPV